MIWIRDLDAHLGGTHTGIEHCVDFADGPLDQPIGECIQANVCALTDMYGSEVVLEDIADYPNVGEIGNGERVRRASQPDAGRSRGSDILGDDDAGSGRVHLEGGCRVIFVDTQYAQLLLGGHQV